MQQQPQPQAQLQEPQLSMEQALTAIRKVLDQYKGGKQEHVLLDRAFAVVLTGINELGQIKGRVAEAKAKAAAEATKPAKEIKAKAKAVK